MQIYTGRIHQKTEDNEIVNGDGSQERSRDYAGKREDLYII